MSNPEPRAKAQAKDLKAYFGCSLREIKDLGDEHRIELKALLDELWAKEDEEAARG